LIQLRALPAGRTINQEKEKSIPRRSEMRKTVILVLVAALFVASCAGNSSISNSAQRILGGGAIGAASGAIIGTAAGNTAAGAAIGAGTGLIAGTIYDTYEKSQGRP
jgi:uncharacterized membrane protein